MKKRSFLKRRGFLKGALAVPVAAAVRPAGAARPAARVRPDDAGWPDAASWDRLRRDVGGRLSAVASPLDPCRAAPAGEACSALFGELKNPYYIGATVGLTQTCGWVDAWTAAPSAYAVAAQSTDDVMAAVNFARANRLRLVVKGGGHSYLGTSNAPDSLMIWTRAMNRVVVHDGFVAQGCARAPQPAVSIGAGAIWMHSYDEVTTRHGRYVQGGGCGTVGVAGLVLGGGFGSYAKTYGTAAASLLEAELVTADGVVRVANECSHPDLFWALKGGGGGSFGVVTRLTLRTHDLPEWFGVVAATMHAASDRGFRRLVGWFVDFYGERLLNPHWGEIATIRPGRRLDIRMEFQGMDRAQAAEIWQPFFDAVGSDGDLSFTMSPLIRGVPARHRWDPAFLKAHAPAAVITDDRPGAASDNVFWSSNLSETGHFLYGFESAWLPQALLRVDRRGALVDALLAAGRISAVELHFQKGLAGATNETLAASRDTATNPAVLDAFALAIIAGEGPPAFPGLPGHEPDLAEARQRAAAIGRAMGEIRRIMPDAGSYVAESNFFQPAWQAAYWGAHYPRLLDIKRAYDPEGLFFVRHGVGSEGWSEDGFTQVVAL
ncbi:MAG TPA: FAD-binding protein [Acetobacteraceae bacterium]|jgi:FAD/FMN-containing dehydrogenase